MLMGQDFEDPSDQVVSNDLSGYITPNFVDSLDKNLRDSKNRR